MMARRSGRAETFLSLKPACCMPTLPIEAVSAYASEVVRIDVWASGAAIAAISIAAMLAFSDWEEWFNLVLGLWSMVSPWALGFMHTMRCT